MSPNSGHRPTAQPGATPAPPPPPPASPSPLDAQTRAVVRAAEEVTTQVRRIADYLTTTAAQAVVDASSAQQTDYALAPTPADDALRGMLADALTAEHRRRARERIEDSPEGHSAAMADVAMRVLGIFRRAEATTCSARWAKANEPMRWCIRAAHHTGKDHVDEVGYHWSDTVAVYPVADGVVRQWTPPVRKLTHPVPADAYATWTEQAPTDGVVKRSRPFPYPSDMAEDEALTRAVLAADEEDAQLPARRQSLRVLINRVNTGVTLTADEAQLLARHVATEIRDANTGRTLATKLQQVGELLRVAHETSNRSEAERARAVQRADEHRRLAAHHATELEAAQAAIERVHAVVDQWAPLLLPRSEAHRLMTDLRAALKGAAATQATDGPRKQHTTEQP